MHTHASTHASTHARAPAPQALAHGADPGPLLAPLLALATSAPGEGERAGAWGTAPQHRALAARAVHAAPWAGEAWALLRAAVKAT